MSTQKVGKVRRARKVDPNGNIYYDRGVSDIIFDPIRGTSVKRDIDELRGQMLTCLAFIAANPKGMDGKSAYDIAVDLGFEGTIEEWYASIHGENGEDGKDAYEIACLEGFTGTRKQWLYSLQGEKGDKGDSAYDIAVRNGFEGTEEEWYELNSLEPVTKEQIQAIFEKYCGDIEDFTNGDYSGLLERVNAIDNKVGTIDSAMLGMVVDIDANDNEAGDKVLTATKYDGSTKDTTIIEHQAVSDVAAEETVGDIWSEIEQDLDGGDTSNG